MEKNDIVNMSDVEERIFDAALRVFDSEGYASATTCRIAQEATVTERTLLQKFISKENLLKEALSKNKTVFLKYWGEAFQSKGMGSWIEAETWIEAYKNLPPWDISHSQPAYQALIETKEIKPGRVLDIGCGRGENSLMLAVHGYDVTGIDLVEDVISNAKVKAIEHHVKVNFLVGNVLEMDRFFIEDEFDIVIDSGLFHVMTDENMPVFARQVCRALKTDGKYFMLGISDKEPIEGIPKISKAEIENTFKFLFNIIYIKDATFDTRFGPNSLKAYLLSAVKS
jgi:2-polyprenyl-3-methyl-5-hydroxy-6-metoxy-1,4-benzoquinol methylase